MQGRILDWTRGFGVILAADGHRYWFDAPDWQGGAPPAKGQPVEFDGDDATDKASSVTPLSQPSSDNSYARKGLRTETLIAIGVALTVIVLAGLFLFWWGSR